MGYCQFSSTDSAGAFHFPYPIGSGGAGPTESAREPIVVGMRSDPEPEHTARYFDGQCDAGDPHGAVFADLFEMKRGVIGIVLQQLEVASGKRTNLLRKRDETLPELRRGAMLHSSWLCPAS